MMGNERIASIDATALYKGQTIPAELAWDYFTIRRKQTVDSWIAQHGSEEAAKAARISLVLQRVIGWLDRDRHQAGLQPLVMNTTGGVINVLTDVKASSYLNDLAFQGLRRHARATTRLATAVDESKLTAAARRDHQNRMNVHAFISASAQGAQRQLRLLRKAGKDAPRLEGG